MEERNKVTFDIYVFSRVFPRGLPRYLLKCVRVYIQPRGKINKYSTFEAKIYIILP